MLHQFPAKQHRPNSKQYFCNLKKSKLSFIEYVSTDFLKAKAGFSYALSSTPLSIDRIILAFNSKTVSKIHFKVCNLPKYRKTDESKGKVAAGTEIHAIALENMELTLLPSLPMGILPLTPVKAQPGQ